MEDKKTIYLFFLIVVVSVHSLTLSFRTMPFCEGWYSYYAVLINSGEVPYRDFCYLLSPIYMYFISFFTYFFGSEIYVLRILGCLIYAGLAITLFICLLSIFDNWIAFLGTVIAVFYLQTESAQNFYDYIRVMDISALLTTYFLIISIKELIENNSEKDVFIRVICSGIAVSCFVLIKQNMGLIFWAFMLIVYIFSGWYLNKSFKFTGKICGLFILSSLALPLGMLLCMFFSNSVGVFFHSSSQVAISAKGGMFAILFNWIINGYRNFADQVLHAFFLVGVILLAKRGYVKYGNRQNVHHYNLYKIYLFCGLFVFLYGVIIYNETIGIFFLNLKHMDTNPYAIFMAGCFLMIYYMFNLYGNRKKGIINTKLFLTTILLGAYFAISYGCGTSGGLVEGQATLGLATITCVILFYLNYEYRFGKVVFAGLILLMVIYSLHACVKKMIHPYNWWGCTETSIWDAQYYSHVPQLKHIKLSKQQVDVYDSIYDAVQSNTTLDDNIIVFPHMPVFYLLTDRYDPGVYCKVQWFDVVDDQALDKDMFLLETKLPKAVLIYDTDRFAYDAHEKYFRKGERSGTRKYREYLYNLVYRYDYNYYGTYYSGNNKIQLYIKKEGERVEKSIFAGGDGSYDHPYLIQSLEQLKKFTKMVHEGRTFDGMYIKQIADIDLGGEATVPIGELSNNSHFDGYYNGDGYEIRNINIKTDGAAGLFGNLGGIVYNVNIIGGHIEGSRCAAVACGSRYGEASVFNCYANVHMTGGEVGGIVSEDFQGNVSNTLFTGERNGMIMLPTQVYHERNYFLSSGNAGLNLQRMNDNLLELNQEDTIIGKKIDLNFWEYNMNVVKISSYRG